MLRYLNLGLPYIIRNVREIAEMMTESAQIHAESITLHFIPLEACTK